MHISDQEDQLKQLHKTLSDTLRTAQQAIAGILESHGVDLDDEAVRAATEAPEGIARLPPNKGGIWPRPTVRSLCDWRTLIYDMRTEEDHDRTYYQAVLDVLNEGMLDVAHVQALWALDSAIAFIEVRSEALEEILDARTAGHGVSAINDPGIQRNMDVIVGVIEVYRKTIADLRSHFPLHVDAIQNQIIKENELYRLEEESE